MLRVYLFPVMLRWREAESALLKGMEVKLQALMAEACVELEPTMIIWRASELAGRKGDDEEIMRDFGFSDSSCPSLFLVQSRICTFARTDRFF